MGLAVKMTRVATICLRSNKMKRLYTRIGNTILCMSGEHGEVLGEKVQPGALLFSFSTETEESAKMVLEDLEEKGLR